MFDLKKPCKDCPFVCGSSTNISLREDRIDEIKQSLLSDSSFTCHKTIDYDNGDTSKNQQCVGSMLWLYKQDRPNQIMRIAERLGYLKESNLSCSGKIID